MPNLDYPVIFIARDGYVDVRPSAAALTTTGVKALRKGLFEHALLIDHRGSAYRVQGTKRIGYEPPFWGFRLTYSRRIRLELDLLSEGNLDLDETKDRVITAIKRHPHLWDSIVDKSLDTVLSHIRSASSREELISLLAA